jgi:hypothetical protein
MENYFYSKLNENAVEAVRRDAAFFMDPPDSRIPAIVDSYSGQPITGANYFNLQLSNDLSGKGHTEYVKMNEALSSNRDWLSTLPRENRPRGTLYQEERADSNAGYSFVMPTAELNQNIYRDNRNADVRSADNRAAAPAQNYVPYQSSNASMGNFDEFVHEQFANAVNASLANCPFKNNIHPHEMEQFKTQLVNEISRNPAFMAMAADKARDEALNYHYLPFDRKQFIEKARDETSPEFTRLNSTINDHVHDMYRNRKESFNPEFNELARPLIIKVENLYLGNPNSKPAVDGEITGFVKKMIKQEKPAEVLADTYAGTFVEKAIKLVKTGKKVFAGVMLAGALIGSQYILPGSAAGITGALIAGAGIAGSIEQIMNFCKTATNKMGGGDVTPSRLDDVVKVAGNVVTSQELKGNNTLRTFRDQDDPQSFYTQLNQTIRDDPQTLEQAITRLKNLQHDSMKTMTRGQAMQR